MRICLTILIISALFVIHDLKYPYVKLKLNKIMSKCLKIIILIKIINLCEIEDERK